MLRHAGGPRVCIYKSKELKCLVASARPPAVWREDERRLRGYVKAHIGASLTGSCISIFHKASRLPLD